MLGNVTKFSSNNLCCKKNKKKTQKLVMEIKKLEIEKFEIKNKK